VECWCYDMSSGTLRTGLASMLQRERMAGRRHRGKQLGSIRDRGGKVYSDLELVQCRFVGAFVSLAKTPRRRSVMRKVRFENCQTLGCTVYSAIFQDVVVDGLDTSG
jgi:hypothetical protein